MLHARSALKSWFCNFLTSSMRQFKIPKIWRRALIVVIPKPEKPLGDPKSYRPISLLCVSFKILERLTHPCTCRTHHCSHGSRRAFNTGGRPWTRSPCWHRTLRIAFWLPPEMVKEAGYDASKTASHRDLSWQPFFSTSASLTCQPPSPESIHMLTI